MEYKVVYSSIPQLTKGDIIAGKNCRDALISELCGEFDFIEKCSRDYSNIELCKESIKQGYPTIYFNCYNHGEKEKQLNKRLKEYTILESPFTETEETIIKALSIREAAEQYINERLKYIRVCNTEEYNLVIAEKNDTRRKIKFICYN